MRLFQRFSCTYRAVLLPEASEWRSVFEGMVALCLLALLLCLPLSPFPSVVHAAASFFSGPGNLGFLICGFSLLLFYGISIRNWHHVRVIIVTASFVTIMVHVQKFVFYHWLTRPTGRPAGFPSGHAALAFALAVLLAVMLPRVRWAGFSMAVAISWSRVFVTAHWPYQVLAGAVTGLVTAILVTEFIVRRPLIYPMVRAWSGLIMLVLPCLAICYFHHEYENDVMTLLGVVLLLVGVIMRNRQYCCGQVSHMGEAHENRELPLMRFGGSVLICLGLVIGSELPWLLPLELLICVAVFLLSIQRETDSATTSGLQNLPSMPINAVYPWRTIFSSPAWQKSWYREAGWASLLLLIVIKELIA